MLATVDHDDLADGRTAHVALTVSNIHVRCPDLMVETLVGDFVRAIALRKPLKSVLHGERVRYSYRYGKKQRLEVVS